MDADDPVERLVARCIDHLRSEGIDGLDALLREEPALAAEARRKLDALHRMGLLPVPGGAPARFGRYEVLETLGRGGMGVVYRVRDDRLGRELALKALAPHVLPDAAARARFRLEARALARLRHEHVVRVHDAGEVDGAPYFTMERVEGITLDRVLAALRTCGSSPAAIGVREWSDALANDAAVVRGTTLTEFAVYIALDVARALEHAHRHGVLHRDVKPANVLVAANGRGMLFDFGVAQLRDEPRVTKAGELLGTLDVMAPELLRGSARADARADVFGLGATLYEVLTLVAPFRGASAAETLARLESGRVDSARMRNPSVRVDLDVVCRTALAPDPDDRYASAAEFAADLERVLRREPIAARSRSWRDVVRAKWRSRRVRIAALATAVVLFAGAIGFQLAVLRRDEARDPLGRAAAQLAEFERIEHAAAHCRPEAARRLAGDLARLGDVARVVSTARVAATNSADVDHEGLAQLERRAVDLERRNAELAARLRTRAEANPPPDGTIAAAWSAARAVLQRSDPEFELRPQTDLIPMPVAATGPLRFWHAFSGSDPQLGGADAALVLHRIELSSGVVLVGDLTPEVQQRIGGHGADPLSILDLREATVAERDAAKALGIVALRWVARDWR
jgi:tRNA A-37 threonylcarbamoyl transferase component Bud32